MTAPLTTTLADIREARPCPEGFAKIRDHFGVSASDAKDHTEPFPVALLLETNDLDDTLWVLDKVLDRKFLCRLFAADCAERVLPIFEQARPSDKRPTQAIAVARNPEATERDLVAAWAAAEVAAWDAAWDAWDAGDAAWAAARAAAGGAAWRAARAAAGDVETEAQTARLRQYLEHGEDASQMPWPEVSS